VVETIAKHLLLLRRWDGPARPTMVRNILECEGTVNLLLRPLLRVAKRGIILEKSKLGNMRCRRA